VLGCSPFRLSALCVSGCKSTSGLLDELDLHVVPLLLGAGERILNNLDAGKVKFELARTLAGSGVTHLNTA
jgi:hypothetical protein